MEHGCDLGWLRSDIWVDFADRCVRILRIEVYNYTRFIKPLNVVEFVHIDGITSVSVYSLQILIVYKCIKLNCNKKNLVLPTHWPRSRTRKQYLCTSLVRRSYTVSLPQTPWSRPVNRHTRAEQVMRARMRTRLTSMYLVSSFSMSMLFSSIR